MKIIWVNNIIIPKIAKDISCKSYPIGGWMVKMADEISSINDVDLCIIFPYSVNLSGKIDNIDYYSFQTKSSLKKDENYVDIERIKDILKREEPDVIHVFGTEYPHSYFVTQIANELGILHKVVISIQGLASICAKHYYAFLGENIINKCTIRDFLKGNLKAEKKEFIRRGVYEIKAIKNTSTIIGRTDWDRCCTHLINPNAKYYFNNEMLRSSFYGSEKWDIYTCERYRIFMSQASMPIKGLHLALEAITYLLPYYPDLKLYIAGKNLYKKKLLFLSAYEKWILNYIQKNNLKKHVVFTGFLDEKEMINNYLKSHVFVSASSIENSPNSVCEAMILGVPVVCSFVGGVVNLIDHGLNGYYYQSDAPYMLAYYIGKIFGSDSLAIRLSEKSIAKAEERHDISTIVQDLYSIYKNIGS